MLHKIIKLYNKLNLQSDSAACKKLDDIISTLGWSRIFVYGSLRNGEENYYRLNNPHFECNNKLNNYTKIEKFGGWAITPGKGYVLGEVYLIPTENLVPLDKYESPEFKREKVKLNDNRESWVWIVKDTYL